MEPGHEDREDDRDVGLDPARILAAMEPGHEDREERSPKQYRLTCENVTRREHCQCSG